MRRYRFSTWFFLGALALVALLTALPSTGWLVRMQLRLITGGDAPGAAALRSSDADQFAARTQSRLRAVAAAAPADFPLHLAAALDTAPPTADEGAPAGPLGIRNGTVRSLLPLRARFDAQPGLHADILRFLCMGDLKLDRPETDAVLLPPRKDPAPVPLNLPRPTAPAILALAEAEAARGEALEPRNGFFPLMRALALFEEHKDTDALAALHRAADATTWNDYASDEARARLRLSRATFGRTGALSEIAIQAAILFPDYSHVRAVARVATALAVLREQAGDTEGGFAIRRDVARVGALMRAAPTFYIGNLVGAAITRIASSRPGGAPAIEKRRGENEEEVTAAVDARYVAYLAHIGHPEEGQWFLTERQAADHQKSIMRHAQAESDYGMRSILWLCAWWAGCIALLVSALWTLVLGGGAALLARTPRIRAGRPLHRAIRWGFALTVLLPALWCGAQAAFESTSIVDTASLCLLSVGFLAIAVPIVFLKRGETWRGFGRNLAICAGTVAASAAIFGAASATLGFLPRIGSVFGLFSGYMASPTAGVDARSDGPVALLLASGALFVPGILAVTLAIRSRIRRVSASMGVVRGFRSAALPVAGALLLLYGAAVGVTLSQENAVSTWSANVLNSEGKYYASLVGETWPGPVAPMQ